MSSILKALKKLEKEAPPQSEDQPFAQEIDTKKTLSQHVRKYQLFNKFFLASGAAVILIIGGWLIFGHRPHLRERPSPGPAPPKIEKKEVKRAPITAQKAPAKKPVTPPEKGTRIAALSEKKPSAPEPVKRSEPPATKSKKEPVKKQPVDASRFDESRVKLEAIIWSNNVESRFAVINGRIVRAGGSVEGMSVENIGRD